ncbi:hypothetical protein [Plasticicumulans sp.]|uniref:hypothetical protein n=1 Tax=Plasticicumulans sp. TaxID=2307179 RepID=UPI0039295F11
MLRGGSWNNKPQNLRSANRNRNNADEANDNVGIRLASTPAPPAGVAGFTDPASVPVGVHGPRSSAPHGGRQPKNPARMASTRGW